MNRPLLSALLYLAVPLAVSCVEPEDTTAARDAYLCARDPAMLALRLDCDGNADCPCGASCDLGRCEATCLSDADCRDGAVCDVLGECGPEMARDPVPAISTGDAGRLGVAPQGLSLRADRPEGVFAVRAVDGPLAAARVLAPDGVEVSCDGGAGWGPDCRLEAMRPEDGPSSVRIRVVDAPRADGVSAYDVRVVAPTGREVVDVRFGVTDPSEEASARAGAYRGAARLVAVGLEGRPEMAPLPDAVRGLALPLEAYVHPGDGGGLVVELRDGLGALFGADGAVGALDAAGTTLILPATSYLGGPSRSDAEVRVSGAAQVTPGTDGLGMRLVVDFLGVTDGPATPYLELALTLARVGDVPADRTAPTVPAPAAPTHVGRARTPLPLEASALGVLVSAALASSTPLPVEGSPASVLARLCTAPSGGALGAWDGAVVNAWSGEPRCAGGRVLALRLAERSGWDLETQLARCADAATEAAEVRAGDAPALGDRDCFDGGRLLSALVDSLGAARDRGTGTPTPPLATSEALAHRTAQQWIEAHAFLASLVRQAEGLNRLLGETEQVGLPDTPTRLLARAVEGWDALLHPRVATGLLHLAPTTFQAPDPRPRLLPGPTPARRPHHTFALGLPVSMARGLHTQLAALRERLVRDRFTVEGRDELDAVATALARRAVVAYAIARGLYDTARAQSAGDLPWEREWREAEAALGAALGGLARNLDDFRRQSNPLGVDDALDLPLYRTGPEATAQDRFSAVSEYLLGAPGAGVATAWVPTQLARAEAAFGDAADAVAAIAARDFAADLEEAAATRREEAIRRRYGEAIVGLCGDPSWDAFLILDDAASIDPETCFLAPGCEVGMDEVAARLDPGDAAYRLCLYGRVQARRGADPAEDPADPALSAAALVRIRAGDVAPTHVESLGEALAISLSDGSVLRLEREAWDRVERLFLDASIAPDAFAEDHAACDAVRQDALAGRPASSPARCFVSQDCPVGFTCDGDTARCAPSPTDDALAPSCFRGALGELALGLRAASREVDVARSEMKEYGERYDRAMRSCILTQVGNDAIEAALARHNDAVDAFAVGKLAADVVANTAAAVKDTAAASSNVYAGVTAGIAAGVEAAARSTSDGLQFAIERLGRDHEETMRALEGDVLERVCFNDAEIHLVGVRTAGLRIQQASLELARQLVELENQKVSLRSFLVEGLDALSREEARAVTPSEMDFWLSDDVERLDASMRRARRALYLAALAVQYELQLSFSRRVDILSAERPSTLREIYETLQALRGTGLVDGASPGNRVAVVSLRRNLLQLADRSAFPPGWHEMTDVQRFQALVSAPENAVHDGDGRYLGQEIAFTVGPLGAVGLGESQGVPLLTSLDCAERLWSVNASLVGEALSAVPDSTVTDVVVRKRNTFYSQWCGAGDGSTLQVASTRPSRNLFLDPYAERGAADPGLPRADLGALDEARAFTNARVRAFFGVPRGELERDDYFNGESTELAGRGLYGDYALFFPVETLSRDGSDGLRLENLEDVLLRFDYVSVASR